MLANDRWTRQSRHSTTSARRQRVARQIEVHETAALVGEQRRVALDERGDDVGAGVVDGPRSTWLSQPKSPHGASSTLVSNRPQYLARRDATGSGVSRRPQARA